MRREHLTDSLRNVVIFLSFQLDEKQAKGRKTTSHTRLNNDNAQSRQDDSDDSFPSSEAR
jgi:hypothetical protein